MQSSLGPEQPEVYRPGVGLTLDCLGNVQVCVEGVRSGVPQPPGCAHHSPANWRDNGPMPFQLSVAITLRNLGSAHRDLSQLEAARDCFGESSELFAALAQQQPEDYGPYLASTLNCLGNVERD